MRRAVASRGGSSSRRRFATVRRPACAERLTAAITVPSRPWIGAAIDRSPTSSSWSTSAQPCRRTASSFGRSASGHSAGSPAASSTRPIEVRWAGKRVPTLIATRMIRETGTRAT